MNNSAASVLLSSEDLTTVLDVKNDINNLKLNEDGFRKDKALKGDLSYRSCQ